ncbi:MAG TPA: hypothetical protein VG722_07140 [Tepidisphaeraceae bacterium]|nr:hypothetical protein [Tepidisphaeraceae bacterium]
MSSNERNKRNSISHLPGHPPSPRKPQGQQPGPSSAATPKCPTPRHEKPPIDFGVGTILDPRWWKLL